MSNRELLRFHAFCLTDTGTRLEQFDRAIHATVQPGNIVVDLGTGSGVLAYLACRAGASRVYAIEGDRAVGLAHLLAPGTGYADRITFIDRPSFQVTLPERVDVVLGDVFDTFGLQARGLSALIDARHRFLNADGRMVPGEIRLEVAPVEAGREYRGDVDVWSRQVLGIDLTPLRTLAINQPHPARFEPSQLLAAPAVIATVRPDLESPRVAGILRTTIDRDGVLHGLCGSFVATLADGITIRNTPGDSSTSNFAQALFPIAQPTPVAAGDTVDIELDWYDGLEVRWRVTVWPVAGGAARRFEGATLFGALLDPAELHRLSTQSPPRRSAIGQAEYELLARCDGTQSTAALAAWAHGRFPDLFPTAQEAGVFVRSVVARAT